MIKTPKLRFPQFSGEWNFQSLGELLEFKNGINGSKEQYGTGIKFVNVLDILNNSFITYDKILGSIDIDEETLEKNAVKYGDVLFQRSSETRDEVGLANVYLDKDRQATFGGFVIRGKKIGEYDPNFINKLLQTSMSRKEISTRAGGSTRYNVGQEVLSEVKLLFPPLVEQEKIGSFLAKIDRKVEKQQEKVELLNSFKKGMLQRIFLQKVRFKNEDGEDFPEWKETVLSKLLAIPEKNIENDVLKNKLLTVKLHRNGVQVNQNTNTLKIGSTNYYRRKAGQFIYGKQNFFNGAFDIIPDKYDGYLSSGDVPTLDINESKVIPLFLLYYMGREGFYKRAESVASGTGSKRIHESILLGLNISLPTMDEQQKIVTFLSNLELKIEKETNKLRDLEIFRRGILQQMFF